MGQYWKTVNLDKHEFINPHKLGTGLKLGEQVGVAHGPGAALVILCAAMRGRRGGGDLDWDSNYYGPERTREYSSSAPVVEEYNTVAKRTIGRWAGDRIALVGDYAEDSDLQPREGDVPASKIYHLCNDPEDIEPGEGEPWKDISDDVARVIEHECGGKFVGDGWRRFKALTEA